ncbi:MAG: hypothetical protein AAGC88_13450 [Bacteroidota bacterium]
MRWFNSILLVISMIIVSCGEEALQPSPIEAGTGYFPVGVNNSWTYEVQEVNINLAGFDTVNYLLRETMMDSFVNQSNEVTYRLEREKDFFDGAGFRFDSVWTVVKTNQHVIVSENNLALLKIVFPVLDGIEWDGNSFNGQREQQFSMTLLDADSTINGQIYSDLLRVTLADIPQNLTGLDQKKEYYVPGIGLVAKDYTTLKYCTRDCTDDFIIEGGRVLKQSLISYDAE